LKSLKPNLPKTTTIRFYRKKFEEAGLKPEDIKTIEDFQKLPFMTREELIQQFLETPKLSKEPELGWTT